MQLSGEKKIKNKKKTKKKTKRFYLLFMLLYCTAARSLQQHTHKKSGKKKFPGTNFRD